MKHFVPFPFHRRRKQVKPVATPDAVKREALLVIDKCFQVVAGKSEREQKKWCAGRLREALETVDGLVPIVGTFMDLPAVDEAEQHIIEHLVDWAWEQHHNHITNYTTCTPHQCTQPWDLGIFSKRDQS